MPIKKTPHSSQADASGPAEALHIEKFIAGGEGFGRSRDGRPVFVRGAIPGDVVRSTDVHDAGSYLRANAYELVSPSAERREADCPYAARCGGCDWMHATPDAQRAGKLSIFKEALRRTGGVQELPVAVAWSDSERALGYRSRARFHLDPVQGPGFRSAGTHDTVAVERCLVANDGVNAVLARLTQSWSSLREHLRPFDSVEVRALGARTELWFSTPARSKPLRPLARHGCEAALRKALEGMDVQLDLGGKDAAPTVTQPVSVSPDVQLAIAPRAFTQVNWDVNRSIVRELLAGAQVRGTRHFADLCCGNGNLSLPLLGAGLTGVGVENNAISVALARQAAERYGSAGEFVVGDVTQVVKRWVAEARRFDLLVIDPPRAGLGQVAALVPELGARHLFVCACDPVTFARDAAKYMASGYQLTSVTLHDMFPQTHHFEVAAWFDR